MKNIAPLISIVIPMYNRESLVGETLDSVVAQTYDNWDCVVIDDGSTDGSCEVVQEYCEKDPRFKLLRRPDERVKGAPTCRNIGAENASGEYVYFYDSDDILSADFLEAVSNAIREHPDAEYAAFQFDGFLTSPDRPVYRSRVFDPRRGSFFEQIMTNHIQGNTQTFLWRKSLLERVPMKWREGFHGNSDDTDFAKRTVCEAKNGTWLGIPPLAHVRQSNTDSISGESKKDPARKVKYWLQWEENMLENCARKNLSTPKIHKGLFRCLLRMQLIDAVLFCCFAAQKQYFNFFRKHSVFSFYDGMVIGISLLIITVSPLLYLCGCLCCWLPIIGKRFRRAKFK